MNAFKDVFKLLRLQTQCSACLDPGLWMSVVIQWISHVQLLATPWTAECQVSLSFIISWNLLELMSIASVMPSNYLILCRSLLLLPSIFLSIRVFSNELVLHIRWPNYCSFSFSISLSNEYSGLISLLCKGLSGLLANTTVRIINSFSLSLLYGPDCTSIHDYWKNHSFDYIDLCRQSDISAF